MSGQLQPWVVDDGAAADMFSEHEDASSDLMPASRPEAAAARTTQQQQQPETAEQSQPFLVWVGAAAEAAAAFEASSYLPRWGCMSSVSEEWRCALKHVGHLTLHPEGEGCIAAVEDAQTDQHGSRS